VLQANLAAGDELLVVGAADLDLRERVSAALVERCAEHRQAA
jgi:hypothetical protein